MMYNKTRLKAGFTLLELLITVAIIGILAGVGIPAYNGYITSASEGVAQSNLRAISVMESNYFSDTNLWLPSSPATLAVSTAAEINTNLFGGRQTLDVNGRYEYRIENHDSGFEAVAEPNAANVGLETYCLTQSNILSMGVANCP